MNGIDDNDIPVGPAGAEATETAIVPVDNARNAEGSLVWMGYLWCVIAGAFAPGTALLASIFVGYGTYVLTVLRDARSAMTAAGIGLVAAVAAGILLGPGAVPAAILTVVAAAFMGISLGSGTLTSGKACLLCALLALALLGIDSSLATWAGTSLNEAALAQIDETLKSLSAGMTGIEEGIEAARDIMRVLWPSSYTLHALACVIAAALGTRVARSGLKARAPRALTFTEFDPPLWVAVVLLVAIVGLAASQAAPAREVVLMVSANLAMAARFAFGTAGVAVAAWALRRRGMGIVATLFICGVLVFFDMQFFVMAIVGLIDFWANIRHLNRGVIVASLKA